MLTRYCDKYINQRQQFINEVKRLGLKWPPNLKTIVQNKYLLKEFNSFIRLITK